MFSYLLATTSSSMQWNFFDIFNLLIELLNFLELQIKKISLCSFSILSTKSLEVQH